MKNFQILFGVILLSVFNSGYSQSREINDFPGGAQFGVYYKLARTHKFNSHISKFSPAHSLGITVITRKPKRYFGFEFNIEHASHYVKSPKFYLNNSDTFRIAYNYVNCFEASFRTNIYFPIKKFGIYFSPGITLGSYYGRKRKRKTFVVGEKSAINIDPWEPTIFADGFLFGIVQSIGIDYKLNERIKFNIDFSSVGKVNALWESNLEISTRGCRIGIRFQIDNQ